MAVALVSLLNFRDFHCYWGLLRKRSGYRSYIGLAPDLATSPSQTHRRLKRNNPHLRLTAWPSVCERHRRGETFLYFLYLSIYSHMFSNSLDHLRFRRGEVQLTNFPAPGRFPRYPLHSSLCIYSGLSPVIRLTFGSDSCPLLMLRESMQGRRGAAWIASATPAYSDDIAGQKLR